MTSKLTIGSIGVTYLVVTQAKIEAREGYQDAHFDLEGFLAWLQIKYDFNFKVSESDRNFWREAYAATFYQYKLTIITGGKN